MPTQEHYFLSYSGVDALDFSSYLVHALEGGTPATSVWFDRLRLPEQAGRFWDVEIEDAIKAAKAILFVATLDSVKRNSVCRSECRYALDIGKPIVVLRLHRTAKLGLLLAHRQEIDFSNIYDERTKKIDFEAFRHPLSLLHRYFYHRETAAGVLAELKERYADCERARLRTQPGSASHIEIENELAAIGKRIVLQEKAINNPDLAREEVQERNRIGMVSESRGRTRPQGSSSANGPARPFPPPIVPALSFLDRDEHLRRIDTFLSDDAQRVLVVEGRGGLGKTALVLRALAALEKGHLPSRIPIAPFEVAGIVYLSSAGTHRVSAPELFAGVRGCLASNEVDRVDLIFKDENTTPRVRMLTLLEACADRRVVVLLDNFESVLDPDTQTIAAKDPELNDALTAILDAPQHRVKVVLTTQFVPKDPILFQSAFLSKISLDGGLPSPFAEDFLRSQDPDGTLGLKNASPEILRWAQKRTDGNPHALKLLVGILKLSRSIGPRLLKILQDLSKPLPSQMTEALAGYLYKMLDPVAQQVMQALAIFARPVLPLAVDYLLEPYVLGIQSAPILDRLCEMRAVHQIDDGGFHFFQHSIDRGYALSQIPEVAQPGIGINEFSRVALSRRAAEYFRGIRKPKANWTTWRDLDPQIAEFDLRCAVGEYEEAARILLDIDEHYLSLWGHNSLVAQMHEQLRGHLTEPCLRVRSTNRLAEIFTLFQGRYSKAEGLAREALADSRHNGDQLGEATAMYQLGSALYYLGAFDEAIGIKQQCLTLLNPVETPEAELVWLRTNFSLSKSYAAAGEISLAIKFTEAALIRAREITDQRNECRAQAHLGWFSSYIGKIDDAIHYDQEALKIAIKLGAKFEQMHIMDLLAEAYFQGENYVESVRWAEGALVICREIFGISTGSWANQWLAAALFKLGDIPGARRAADEGCKYNEPINNQNLQAYAGVFALLEGDKDTARKSFLNAVALGNEMIKICPRNWEALDAKGLSQSGLSLIEGSSHLAEAVNAFQAARQITRCAGLVRRSVRQVEMLNAADPDGLLAVARSAAAGEMN